MRDSFRDHMPPTPASLFLIISIGGSIISIAWGNSMLHGPCRQIQPPDTCDAPAYAGIGMIIGGVVFSFILASVVALVSALTIAMSERSKVRTERLSIIATEDKN